MANKTIKVCDKCGKENPTCVGTFFVQTGWQSCPAGGASQADGRDFDLCGNCMQLALKSLFKEFTPAKGELFLTQYFRK